MLDLITIKQRLYWIINVFFHQMIAVLIAYVIGLVVLSKDTHWGAVAYHKILLSLGYIFFMGEGILLFNSHNVYSVKTTRKSNYLLHGFFLGTAVVLVSVGIILVIDVKETHFNTIHGQVGLASWILCLLAVVLGVFSYYASKLKNILRPVWFKFIHNLIGMAGFGVGMAAIVTGLYKRYGKAIDNDDNNVIAVMTIASFIGAFACCSAVRSGWDQLKSIVS